MRGRGRGSAFREEDGYILNPKGSVGKEREFFFSANPHTTVIPLNNQRATGLGVMNAANGGGMYVFNGYTYAPPYEGDTTAVGLSVDWRGDAHLLSRVTRNQFGDTSWALARGRPDSFTGLIEYLRGSQVAYWDFFQGEPFAIATDAAGDGYSAGYITMPNGRALGLMKNTWVDGIVVYRFAGDLIAPDQQADQIPPGGYRAEGCGIVVDREKKGVLVRFRAGRALYFWGVRLGPVSASLVPFFKESWSWFTLDPALAAQPVELFACSCPGWSLWRRATSPARGCPRRSRTRPGWNSI